jgi:Leucine-rich repeat (LRR) protein
MVLMTSLLEFLLLNSLNPIPGWWLGRLHGLRNLSVVNVTVVVVEGLDVVLSNMNDLQFLTLQNANLFAPLPVKSWPPNLNSIALSGSDILGTIPAALSELTHLENLDLSNNQLNGHIPSSLGELQKLQILSLAANRLTGPIPASFGNLSALQKLDLSFNSLNGTLPPALGQLLGLTDLDLRGNRLLGGAIPFPTNVLKNMKTFLVSGTNLCYDPILTSAELARGFSIPLCG